MRRAWLLAATVLCFRLALAGRLEEQATFGGACKILKRVQSALAPAAAADNRPDANLFERLELLLDDLQELTDESFNEAMMSYFEMQHYFTKSKRSAESLKVLKVADIFATISAIDHSLKCTAVERLRQLVAERRLGRPEAREETRLELAMLVARVLLRAKITGLGLTSAHWKQAYTLIKANEEVNGMSHWIEELREQWSADRLDLGGELALQAQLLSQLKPSDPTSEANYLAWLDAAIDSLFQCAECHFLLRSHGLEPGAAERAAPLATDRQVLGEWVPRHVGQHLLDSIEKNSRLYSRLLPDGSPSHYEFIPLERVQQELLGQPLPGAPNDHWLDDGQYNTVPT